MKGTYLNTIVEDSREFESLADSPSHQNDNHAAKVSNAHSNDHRYSVPAVVSTGTRLSGIHRPYPDFDDLYDVTDESASDCDSCTSLPGAEPSGISKTPPTGRRNRYPAILIPQSKADGNMFLQNSKLSSPVPPTPPPKIPVSPAALSRLSRTVPPIYDAPSLAGSNSASSAHPSSASAPPTPDLGAVGDRDWNEQRLRVYSDSEKDKDSPPTSGSISPQPDIELETPEDWSSIINSFPRIPQLQPPSEVEAYPISSDDESQKSTSAASSNRGVRLPSEALDTLKYIDIDDQSSQNSFSSNVDELGLMSELVRRPAIRRRSTGGIRLPSTAGSGSSFTPLSIPSPGGFFESLKGEARRTWCLNNNSHNPPSSATAERFYSRPWDAPGETVVEHVVHVAGDEDEDTTIGPPTARTTVLSSGPPTARRIPPQHDTITDDTNADSVTQDAHMLVEYDEMYEEELKKAAAATFDRTSTWLAAQSAYLAALAETNPMNKIKDTGHPGTDAVGEDNTSVSTAKKSVRFLSTVPEEPEKSDDIIASPKNSLFYRGFQYARRRSRDRDTFNQSYFRYEAIQAARISLMDKYVDHLMGKYELSNPVRPPYRGPFTLAPRNSRLPQVLAEKAMYARVEKEQDVLLQLQSSMWAIDALKYLNGGRLIPSPAASRLAKARSPLGTPESAGKRRRRVLDLGGHPICDWGWYVSCEYPNVKVYTVVSKRQSVNREIRGPVNHRHVSVPSLWSLPFQEGQFDLISARHLQILLKSDRPIGGVDECDLVLHECFRCLKPGGYLEFFLMDAELARAGPYGSATSVEFAFNLKTRGYDPCPTRGFLSRLTKAGFVNLKRAWIFLPMGVAQPNPEAANDASGTAKGTAEDTEEEGGMVGSTSNIASTTGIFGGWMWEQWMLKLQMEMGRGKDNFLEEMATVFEEGRKSGAGWRCLSGWAMKPKAGSRRGSGHPVMTHAPPPLPPFRPLK
ncbi:hypothetical protein VTO42DRAFT_5086 [Malbranchea cinnamomea]